MREVGRVGGEGGRCESRRRECEGGGKRGGKGVREVGREEERV